MIGFDIIMDGQCIHEETGFDVEELEDLFLDILDWYDLNSDEDMTEDNVVAIVFVCDNKDEYTIKEIRETVNG